MVCWISKEHNQAYLINKFVKTLTFSKSDQMVSLSWRLCIGGERKKKLFKQQQSCFSSQNLSSWVAFGLKSLKTGPVIHSCDYYLLTKSVFSHILEQVLTFLQRQTKYQRASHLSIHPSIHTSIYSERGGGTELVDMRMLRRWCVCDGVGTKTLIFYCVNNLP